MNYQDNSKKLALILNGKVGIGPLINAASHAVAGLCATVGPQKLEIEDYTNAATGFVAKISRYPVIVLKAKNGNQLATLRCDAELAGLPVNVFTSSMIGSSSAEQRERTFAAEDDGLIYWAVALFGPSDAVAPLTRKFSLFDVKVGASDNV